MVRLLGGLLLFVFLMTGCASTLILITLYALS